MDPVSSASFEIRHVLYTSNKIKKSRSYRVCVEWSPPDVDTVSTVTTHKIKAPISGSIEWGPLSIKRDFTLLPQTIMITIQERALHILPWSPLSFHKVSCLADQHLEDQIDGILGVAMVVTQPEAASEPDTMMGLHQEASAAMGEAQKTLVALQEHSTQVYGIIDSTVSQSNNLTQFTTDFGAAFPGTISAVEGFLKIGGLLAEVHPIAKVVVDVLNGAYTIVKANALVDEKMGAMLSSMNELCTLTTQYVSSQKQEHLVYQKVETILLNIQQAATLVRAYAEHKKKSGLKCPTYFTSFQQDAERLLQTFSELSSQLNAASVADAFVNIQVIKKDVEHLVKDSVFSALPYAADAAIALHDGSDKTCLPGTRTAILDGLQAWAVGGSVSVALNPLPNSSVPNILTLTDTSVLWLMGVAGSGKSSIAVSLAKYLHSASVCTAYYRFEAPKQHDLNPSNLFTTIALQLAAQNATLEAQLLQFVRSAKDLQQRSEDPTEQLERFLLPLLKGDSTTLIPIVIIIDALDESGGVSRRKQLLKALASLPSHLPSTVHILITAQPELDILDIIHTVPQLPHMSELFMDTLPDQSTKNDIHQYIKHMLEGPPLNPSSEQLEMLSNKAQLSFQWASTACLYIVDQEDGNQAVHPSKRLKNVLSSSSTADSQVALYNLYSTLMDAQFGHSRSEDLKLLRLLLGVLVAARKPLSLAAITQLLHTQLSQYGDINEVKVEAARDLCLMSSVIAGTSSKNPYSPLLPLHTSFFDFIQYSANSKYCVDVSVTHRLLTESCLAVMQAGEKKLKFNICQLTTSFIPNSSIPGLPALIQERIGEGLLYACQFWTSHFSAAPSVSMSTLEAVKLLLSTSQFLYWLEVMSLTGTPPLQSLSLLSAQPESPISSHTAEALHFTSYYASPIALSVPHIYLSAVPFIPASSLLHMLSDDVMKTVSILSGHTERWPTLRHVLESNTSVHSMAVSKYHVLAAGLDNGVVLLWNSQTGQQYGQQLIHGEAGVGSLAFSPDGTVLASGSWDDTIQLWDVRSLKAKGDPLRGHTDWVQSVAFSPNGAILASCSNDQTIQLWDVESQTLKGDPLKGHSGSVLTVTFSPDGSVLASGSDDHTIQLWDVHSHTAKGDPLKGHSGPVYSVAFSPDGLTLASGSGDESIQLWDVECQLAKGDSLKGHSHAVLSIAFSPDSAILASGSTDQTIQLWDVQSQIAMGDPVRSHRDSVFSVAFSSDGELLASGSHDKTIQLQDVHSYRAKGDIARGHKSFVQSVAFSPDGTVCASGSWDHTTQLWDVQSQTAKGDPLSGHSEFVWSVAFSPNGEVLASGAGDETIQLWDVGSHMAKGESLRSHSDTVFSVAFSPDGAILASGSSHESIQLWDVESWTVKGDPLRGHSDSVVSVAFSPDGATLASGSWDQTIWLWDMHSQTAKGGPLKGHIGPVYSVAFSPNGEVLASGSGDQTIQLWDVKSQTPKGDPLRGHSESVWSVAISPDGSLLASGSDDQTIQLWDVQSQIAKADPLRGHTGTVFSVAFSPKGAVLASGSRDRTVRLWDVTSSALCAVVPVPDSPTLKLKLGPAWCMDLHDGWIKGPNDELILWVPPSYRHHLYDERLINIFGQESRSRVRLNFEHMVMGENWASCHTP
ncbi:WD40 repeat-like protein [Clavulina sp. PMI_390]|nr:WD40 repeat-like protein [Clavulina sp. PMI_390]